MNKGFFERRLAIVEAGRVKDLAQHIQIDGVMGKKQLGEHIIGQMTQAGNHALHLIMRFQYRL
ncbi:hypothetical protein [Roseibium sp.]|uniref:hypothetical protein n=1 Tax=Roseibium sp. TaxID=1936156 RepID=UPI003A9837D3